MSDISGEPHTITFADKPTVLLFFTSWCPYCNQDAHKIVNMHERYKDQIQIYGINPTDRDDVDKVKKYMTKHGIQYPVLLDEDSNLRKQFGTPGFPTLVFLDRNGKETNRIRGASDVNIIEKQFAKAAAQ